MHLLQELSLMLVSTWHKTEHGPSLAGAAKVKATGLMAARPRVTHGVEASVESIVFFSSVRGWRKA
jgi:hypothetical protein